MIPHLSVLRHWSWLLAPVSCGAQPGRAWAMQRECFGQKIRIPVLCMKRAAASMQVMVSVYVDEHDAANKVCPAEHLFRVSEDTQLAGVVWCAFDYICRPTFTSRQMSLVSTFFFARFAAGVFLHIAGHTAWQSENTSYCAELGLCTKSQTDWMANLLSFFLDLGFIGSLLRIGKIRRRRCWAQFFSQWGGPQKERDTICIWVRAHRHALDHIHTLSLSLPLRSLSRSTTFPRFSTIDITNVEWSCRLGVNWLLGSCCAHFAGAIT